MGEYTDGIPKLFLELHGKTLYEHQLETLESVCDQVTVVLGYGFVGEFADPEVGYLSDQTFQGEIHIAETPEETTEPMVNREKIARYLATDRDIEVTALVLPHWHQIENAESCRYGLQRMDGEVLLLNGDIVYQDVSLETILNSYRADLKEKGLTAVGVKEGLQDERTAVRWNDEGLITQYGAIEGHQIAGIFVLNESHVEDACTVLAERPNDWFPVLFPAIDSRYVPIPESTHVEINTPEHFEVAQQKTADWV